MKINVAKRLWAQGHAFANNPFFLGVTVLIRNPLNISSEDVK